MARSATTSLIVLSNFSLIRGTLSVENLVGRGWARVGEYGLSGGWLGRRMGSEEGEKIEKRKKIKNDISMSTGDSCC